MNNPWQKILLLFPEMRIKRGLNTMGSFVQYLTSNKDAQIDFANFNISFLLEKIYYEASIKI